MTAESDPEDASPARRAGPDVLVFVILSAVTSLAASLVGLLLLSDSGAGNPPGNAAAILGWVGIGSSVGHPSAWLGYLLLQLGVFEAFLTVAFWRCRPWAYPFLVAKGVAPGVFVLATAGPPWGGTIAGLIGASVLLQIVLRRRVQAQFAR